MSELTNVMKQRRSIRKYKPHPIPAESLRRLVEIASYAPSAHNAQPWRFVVIISQNQKDALADEMAQIWLKVLEGEHVTKSMRWKTVQASVKRFTTAPALVVCCLTMENMDNYPDTERQKNERDLAVQSLAAAIQNLLLAAHCEGLGACWFCAPVFCKEAVRKVLKIPRSVEPQALITIGYSAEKPKPPKRLPLDVFAFLDSYGNPL